MSTEFESRESLRAGLTAELGIEADDLYEMEMISTIGRVVIRGVYDGVWKPRNPVDLFEAIHSAEQEVVGADSPSPEMIAMAMELLYREAWWLNMPRIKDELDNCDMECFERAPSDVFTLEYMQGDKMVSSMMIYVLTNLPLSKDQTDRLSEFAKTALGGVEVERLETIESVFIVPSRGGIYGYAYFGENWIIIGADILSEWDLMTTEDSVLQRHEYYRQLTEGLGAQVDGVWSVDRFALGRFGRYERAIPRPTHILFDASWRPTEEDQIDLLTD
jgi:hypothetical protein